MNKDPCTKHRHTLRQLQFQKKKKKRPLTNLPLPLTTSSPKLSVPNLHSLRLFSGIETVSTNPRLPAMGSLPCTSSWMWFTPLRRRISPLSDSEMVDRRLRHNLAQAEAFDLSLCEWKLSQHQYVGKESRVNWQDGHRLIPQEEVRNGSKLTGWTQTYRLTYSTGRSQEQADKMDTDLLHRKKSGIGWTQTYSTGRSQEQADRMDTDLLHRKKSGIGWTQTYSTGRSQE